MSPRLWLSRQPAAEKAERIDIPPLIGQTKNARKTAPSSRFLKGWGLWILWLLSSWVVIWILSEILNAPPPQSDTGECTIPWSTLGDIAPSKLCISTLSDANAKSIYRTRRRRDFTEILEATWDNKMHYVLKHDYRLYNESHLLNTGRPPAWSKILAVNETLKNDCEWVFWMDPDSLIMNSMIRLEDILPAEEKASLVVTKDVNGYNSGMWMVRKTAWTDQFLEDWWSMSSLTRRAGDTKSGDNDAMKALINQYDAEDAARVFIAPQCSCNSYIWYPSLRTWARYVFNRKAVSRGLYHKGHFVLHFAGIDQKLDTVVKYLPEAS